MILTIDTSSSILTVAIATENADVIESISREASETERGVHDARLAAEVESLLSRHSISAHGISRIAIIIGPGSFTGLRIGLAFAKGLSFACGAAIVPLTQHEVLAYQNTDAENIVTPGYQPKLVYIGSRKNVQKIDLVDEAGYRAIAPTSVSGLLGKYPSFVICDSQSPIDPAAMARLAPLTNSLTGLEIDELEPRYITEFKTGA